MCAIGFKCRRDAVVIIGRMDWAMKIVSHRGNVEGVQVSLRDTLGVLRRHPPVNRGLLSVVPPGQEAPSSSRGRETLYRGATDVSAAGDSFAMRRR